MINTSKIAVEYRLGHWAQIMQERAQSGISVKAYCRQIGICTNTYFYWQRKLREAACTEIQAAAQKDVVPIGWMHLAPTQEQTMKAEINIEVNGCHITVNTETDTDLLGKICRMLRSL